MTPDSTKTTTVGATVTPDMKERIKQVAKAKHWSVGQTLRLFIEAYWDKWVKDLEKPERITKQDK